MAFGVVSGSLVLLSPIQGQITIWKAIAISNKGLKIQVEKIEKISYMGNVIKKTMLS